MIVAIEAWRAKGVELFGDDEERWAFVCPVCAVEMSIERAKRELPELRGRGWRPEQECIGRYTTKTGCNWCAYGLFHGPVFVGDGKTPVFDFAGRPFTAAPAEAAGLRGDS